MFVDFDLILLHHETLFCDGYKEKVCRGYSGKKYKALQELKKVDVAAKH